MKMKFFHIFLILNFLSMSTFGYSISEHYCGKTLQHIAVNKEAHSCCQKSEDDSKSAPCCKNKNVSLKLSDTSIADQVIKYVKNIFIDLFTFVSFENLYITQLEISSSPNSDCFKPKPKNNPFHILYNQIRI